MSNIALVYPNRAIEVARNSSTGAIIGLHAADWTENSNLPLTNMLTDCLPETARTSDLVASFGLSLSKIPYRTIGAVALLNHNLTTAARIKHSVFNEPAIGYSNTPVTIVSSGSISFTVSTLTTTLMTSPPTKLRIFGCSNDTGVATNGDYITGTVTAHNLGTGLITMTISDSNGTAGTSYSLWYVAVSTSVEPKLVNTPKWVNVWQRLYEVDSPALVWESSNFWTGAIEEEQRVSYTKLCLNFLTSKTNENLQPIGTHIHIDIDDSSNGDGFIEIGYFMFGQYFQTTINPQYGAIEQGYIDISEVQQSDSGQKYFHEKAKARTVSIVLDFMDKQEAFGSVYEAYRQQGISRPVIYSFSPVRIDAFQYAQSFIGRFSQLNPITMPNYGLYGATINIEEML
jgi:hypothetical protein